MQSLVSIIVPVYNVEKYLRKCLDSIINQTYQNIEIILVDDGSKDASGLICDEYAKKDARIKVIHKENEGVASARQTGLDNALGEYVIHADSDDWVDPQMIERLTNEAIATKADIVICDYYINDNKYIKQQPSQLNHITVLQDLFYHLHGSCCNKLLRRECTVRYNVSFNKELSYCEDLTFWVKLLKNPVSISYIPSAYYHYINVSDSKSIVHTYMNNNNDEGWKVIKCLWHDLKDYPNIRKIACSRTAFSIVRDAYKYGSFNSCSFTKRHYKYVPFLLVFSRISVRERLGYVRMCLGWYSYYKNK